ncbi:MAG: selenocysteine-specific translation elongation factor [Pseudomonadales bacterium]
MIVTLAGHVDHGKTTLVHRLTGTDTDRLAEEKRRGLTIDLGFAYLHDGGRTVGFVDVPGHHRFIHNMVAGVAALQHALLVIAADDGPMPQSREHLQILELLGIRHGTVALSKCDRVPAQRIADARAEIAALVTGSFLEDAPVLETSSLSDSGVAALRARLLEQAALTVIDSGARPFRLAVDRAFSLRGSGLVATGTVNAGRIAVDDEIFLFPGGLRARVRDLRVQDQPATRAVTGDRAAINLAGVDADAVSRGTWLCGRQEAGHRSVVLDLRMLDDFPRPLRHWTPVHVYHATSHSPARLALLEGSKLEPGARARAELILEEPLVAKRGDRLIVRDHGLERTLGGGSVLDNRPAPGRRRAPERLRSIEACAAASAGDSLDALLAIGPVDVDAFGSLWDLQPADLEDLMASRPARVRQGRLISDALWQQWLDALGDECERRHRDDSTLQGLRENDFATPVTTEFRHRALTELVASGRLQQRAGHYLPTRHRSSLDPEQQALLERLRPLLDQSQPPSLGDLGKALKIPLARLQSALKPLANRGEIVLINDKRAYLPPHVIAMADIAERLSRQGAFTARDYRDAAAIGRNVAIDLLEYFDARGYTRRQGDQRTVVGERSRLLPRTG